MIRQHLAWVPRLCQPCGIRAALAHGTGLLLTIAAMLAAFVSSLAAQEGASGPGAPREAAANDEAPDEVSFETLLAAADDASLLPGNRQSIEPRKFTLRPAAEAVPALRYQLLPPFVDRRPGNAAVLYPKLLLEVHHTSLTELRENIDRWNELPIAELPREEVAAAMLRWRSVLDGLDRAARCEYCDWQLPLREQPFYEILLPEVQAMRQYAKLVAADVRLAIAEGRFDDALRGLQTGFAIARHVAAGPTLVSALVGISISRTMLARVEEFIQQPAAPNLYWALTSLPRPFIDLRAALEVEREFLALSLPAAANPPARAEAVLESLRWAVSGSDWPGTAEYLQICLQVYPQAKKFLIEQGRTAEEVEALSVRGAMGLYVLATYERVRDETMKWMYVPYVEAAPQLRLAEAALYATPENAAVLRLMGGAIPAMSHVYTAQATLEREVAILRTLEQMSDYAAQGGAGRLAHYVRESETLAPTDPMTGEKIRLASRRETANGEVEGYFLGVGNRDLSAFGSPDATPIIVYEIQLAE